MSELKMTTQQQLEAIEAQWDEDDPRILEAAREFLKDDLSTEEEKEKIRTVQFQRGREKEYIYEERQSELFYQHLPNLIKKYSGLYVWFEDGEVKDYDQDEVILCGRVIRNDLVRNRELNAIYVNKVPELN
ncbi:hypothetical protein [Chroococcus sp. FPU101]|uniref:hypothetical protein n=1 Tax=Chroococcus sp. FPU101 TaxID=1974212 RepID=UPI001AAAEFC0|nr:hypothetical protein [Chroococcus sp. FPU101]GFE68460.1 hypothetical protein CFPU101_10700 [Chroococcus sp. FPU101]